jgi:single-strand DNA-binding protein
MDVNKVILVGRLADDIMYEQGKGEKASRAVGKLIINRPPSPNSTKKAYDAVQIVAWGKTADNMANYTSKGKELAITGEIRTNAVAPTTAGGEWKNYTEVMIREVSFGRDSNNAKMMKALHGGNSLVAAAQGVQTATAAPDAAAMAAMLAKNPELKAKLESIIHGANAPVQQPTLETAGPVAATSDSVREEEAEAEQEEDSTSVEAPFSEA